MELVVLLTAFVLIIVLQSWIYKKYAFSNITYSCVLSKTEVFEGEEIELVETIVNGKLLPVPWMKAEITASKWLEFADPQSIVTDTSRFVPSFFMLKGYQKITRKWRVTCARRGVHDIRNIILVSSDLLGWNSLSMPIYTDAAVTVLPRILDIDEAQLMPRYLLGEHLSRRQLIDDPFYTAGVREYAYGDPMNKIHWKSTARQNRIMVRNNDFTTSQSLTVILNMQTQVIESGKVVFPQLAENAIRVCASVFDQALGQGIPVRLATNSFTAQERQTIYTSEASSNEHTLELLRTLARLELRSTEDISIYLQNIYDQTVSSDILLVSAYLSEPILEFARQKMEEGFHVRILVVGFVAAADLPGEEVDVVCLYDYFTRLAKGDQAARERRTAETPEGPPASEPVVRSA